MSFHCANRCGRSAADGRARCFDCSRTLLDSSLERLDNAWVESSQPFIEFSQDLMDATCDVIRAWRSCHPDR